MVELIPKIGVCSVLVGAIGTLCALYFNYNRLAYVTATLISLGFATIIMSGSLTFGG